jgi:putative resolvase
MVLLMNNGEEWVTVRKACKIFGATSNTIRKWGDSGHLKCKRTPANHRVYLVPKQNLTENQICPKNSFIYARVSSKKQENDLERQISFLSDKYPGFTIIKDIGSGLNYKRRGLIKLIDLSSKGQVDEIVVFSKDRLCRFGFELLEHVFNQNNTKLLVYEQTDKSPEQEFTEDILAILQIFACRWNGKRKYRIKTDTGSNEVQIEVKQYTEKTDKPVLQ